MNYAVRKLCAKLEMLQRQIRIERLRWPSERLKATVKIGELNGRKVAVVTIKGGRQ